MTRSEGLVFSLGALFMVVSAGCAASGTATGSASVGANPGQPGGGPDRQGVGGAPPSASPTRLATRPRTEDACRACNGVWGIHGLAQTEACNCRTIDGGKKCRDGNDCQGMCIAAEEPEREVVSAGPPPRGFFVGRCSDLVTVFGCNRIISRGATPQGPTLLSEPPSSICVD